MNEMNVGPSVWPLISTQRYLTALSSFVTVSQRVNIVCYRHLLWLVADTPSRKHVDDIFHGLCVAVRVCNAICVCVRTESHFFSKDATERVGGCHRWGGGAFPDEIIAALQINQGCLASGHVRASRFRSSCRSCFFFFLFFLRL